MAKNYTNNLAIWSHCSQRSSGAPKAADFELGDCLYWWVRSIQLKTKLYKDKQ